MNWLKVVFLAYALLETNVSAFKILFIQPAIHYSHQQPAVALAEGLAKMGHEVFLVGPDMIPGKHNYTQVDISLSSKAKSVQKGKIQMLPEKQILKWEMLAALELMTTIPAKQFKTEPFLQFQRKVREENITFDVAILESFFIPYSCALTRHLSGDIPMISINTNPFDLFSEESLGNIQHFSYMPSFLESYTDRMSLWQKMDNWLINHHCVSNFIALAEKNAKQFFRESYGPKYESLVDGCWKSLSLAIVPSNPLYYYPRLLSPNVIELGPVHIKPPQKLPEILQSWLDGAETGVIYFSLGSNMKSISLPEVALSNFLKFFKQLPSGYRVLWKWERDGNIPGQSDNILAQQWIPQQSVLAHPKVKVFITQGGLQSFQEAVHYGVPTVGIPWWGDQNINVAKMADAEIGVRLQPPELVSYEKVSSALQAILNDERYSKNMKKHSAISHDFTAQAIDKAVFWVEHVARHGGASHLRPSTADTTYFQFFCLDIISVILALGLSAFLILAFVLKFLVSVISQKLKLKIKEA